jgi:hypothetical protein
MLCLLYVTDMFHHVFSVHDYCYNMAIFSDLHVPNMGPVLDPNMGQGSY